MENDNLVFYGGEIKAMGDGKVGGYLVQFKSVDLEGDFFDSLTDYGIEDGARLPVYYQHGLDATIKNRKIGKGTIRIDDAGLWLEAQLEMRDEYERVQRQEAQRKAHRAGEGAQAERVMACWSLRT